MKKTICKVIALVSVLALTLSANMRIMAYAKASDNDEAAARQYVEEQLDKLTLGPSANKKTYKQSGSTSSNDTTLSKLTGDEIATYSAKVFELVNKEREKAGVPQIIWDDGFAACSQIRAVELQYLFSHTRPVSPKDNNKTWPKNTNGIGEYNAPSVADEQGIEHTWIMENASVQRETPEAVVEAWMKSTGHRANILKESHTRCGVGVYFTNEKTPTGYQRFWILWFDDYSA